VVIHAGLRGPGHMSAAWRPVSTTLALSGAPGPATQNTAFSFAPARTGGTGPYSFSIVAGTLPTGLSLNSTTGVVSGTPSVVGTSSGITLRVTDSATSPATADLAGVSFVVSAVLAISGTAPAVGTVGSAYSFTPGASGGRGTKTFVLTGTLPAGLSFNGATGVISGTPSGVETQSGLSITVTDADGRTASLAPFSIAVSAASSGVASASAGASFMRDTIVKAARLGVTNSTKCTVAWSMRGTMFTGAAIQGNSFAGQVIMQSDPATAGEVTAGVAPGLLVAFENSGIAQLNFNNSTGVTPGVDDIKFGLASPYTRWFTDDAWNTYLLTWDTVTGDWAMYWGDGSTGDMVDLRAAGVATAVALPSGCLADWNNINGLMIGASTWAFGGAYGQLGDIYAGVGETISNGAGAIPLATLRKFYAAGKPQDLTSFPTGRQPEILLLGGAAGLTTNLGTAAPSGGFAVAPSLFIEGVAAHDGYTGDEAFGLMDAAFGPGAGEPAGPHYRWTAAGSAVSPASVTFGTQVHAPDGHRISVGDLLLMQMQLQDRSGAFDHQVTVPDLLKSAAGANQASAWTSLTGGSVNPSADVSTFQVCYRFADAADVRMAESYSQRDASLVTTSSTSVTIPGGPPGLPNGGAAFNMTFSAGKGFVPGDVVEVYNNNQINDRLTRFWATLNSYDAGTGVANLTAFASEDSVTSNTHWTMTLGGYRWRWTMSGSGAGSALQTGQAFLDCYGGVSAVGATNFATAGWANPGSISTGGITTSHANAVVVSGFLADDATPHCTPHAGATWAARWRNYKTGSGGSCQRILADELKASAGAYGAQRVDLKAIDASSTFNGFVLGFNLELVP